MIHGIQDININVFQDHKNIINEVSNKLHQPFCTNIIMTFFLSIIMAIIIHDLVIRYNNYNSTISKILGRISKLIMTICVISIIWGLGQYLSFSYDKSHSILSLRFKLVLHKWLQRVSIQDMENNQLELKILTKQLQHIFNNICSVAISNNRNGLIKAIINIFIILIVLSITINGVTSLVRLTNTDTSTSQTNGQPSKKIVNFIKLINKVNTSIKTGLYNAIYMLIPIIILTIITSLISMITFTYTYNPMIKYKNNFNNINDLFDKLMLYKLNGYLNLEKYPEFFQYINMNKHELDPLDIYQYYIQQLASLLTIITIIIFIHYTYKDLLELWTTFQKFMTISSDYIINILFTIMIIVGGFAIILSMIAIRANGYIISNSCIEALKNENNIYELKEYIKYMNTLNTRSDNNTLHDLTGNITVKKFGINGLFDNLSFIIPSASITIIMAPSGFGISTLLNYLTFKISTDTLNGQILFETMQDSKLTYINSENLSFSTVNSHINQVIPMVLSRRLLDNVNIARENCTPALLYTLRHDIHMNNIWSNYWQSKTINNASGGEKQRIGIMRSLIHIFSQPIKKNSMLIIDKGLSGIDHNTRDSIMMKLKQYQAKYQELYNKTLTIILCTDDQADLKYGNHIVYINNNREVQSSHDIKNITIDAE